MKIAIIGSGYVGLVTGACLADTGNEVWCVDKNGEKIGKLAGGTLPIYEPGLAPIVIRGVKESRLFFTTTLAEALETADISFLTVDTPAGPDGRADLTNVKAVAEAIGSLLEKPMLIVTKSTVPVGTTLAVKKIIQAKLNARGRDAAWVSVASNPEFLKEGTAVQDFRYPDRIVVGVERPADGQMLRELYEPLMRKRDCFLVMDIASAELSKYAANAMLAARISFMNEMANISRKMGADIDKIRETLGADVRIGPHFLHAGLGYGGSCLPKDVQTLIHLAREQGEPVPLISAIHQTNERQKDVFLQKITGHFGGLGGMRGKTAALWGLAFKPETDDMREAPAIFLIRRLLECGARVRVYDPAAMEKARQFFQNRMDYAATQYDCLEGADCLIIATEWNEFKSPDFEKMKQRMKTPVIFDGRNLFPAAVLRARGFDYHSFGEAF